MRLWASANTLASAGLAALVTSVTPEDVGAATVPIGGVKTEVEVTAPLGDLGLTASPFGTATASGAVFTFPITGGTIDTATGTLNVRHDGSGVALTAPGTPLSAFVGNFVIDAAPDLTGSVFGSAAAFGFGALDDVPLFELAGLQALGVELRITSALAGVLSGYFGAPDLTGEVFGYARPDVAPVPLPAAGFLLLGGMAALGAVRMRRRRAIA
jgi:hypothetical protein